MRVLVVAANPDVDLDLEEEIRTIGSALRSDLVDVKIRMAPAARPADLIRKVRHFSPNVLHFLGHGDDSQICFRSDTGSVSDVSTDALHDFLDGRGVDLVVLNSCYSEGVAAGLVDVVGAVVGTTCDVSDEQANSFSRAFYDSLCGGNTVDEAFRDGADLLRLEGLQDAYALLGDGGSNPFSRGEPTLPDNIAAQGASTTELQELVALIIAAEDRIQSFALRVLCTKASNPSSETFDEILADLEMDRHKSEVQRLKTVATASSILTAHQKQGVRAWCSLLGLPGGPAIKGDAKGWSEASQELERGTELLLEVLGGS